jgi:hypothetical protein
MHEASHLTSPEDLDVEPGWGKSFLAHDLIPLTAISQDGPVRTEMRMRRRVLRAYPANSEAQSCHVLLCSSDRPISFRNLRSAFTCTS